MRGLRRYSKYIFALLLSLGVLTAEQVGWLSAGLRAFDQPPAGYVSVTKVVDGDTIVVNMGGRQEEIRFIGVDTPETKDPRKPIQCFGEAATAYTESKIEQSNDHVRLEADPLNTNRDRYNRLLRHVFLEDDTHLNKHIILDGYGFAYTSFPFSYIDEFQAAQVTARQENRGLWSDCQPQQNDYGGFTSPAASD